MSLPLTAAEILKGHVTLELEGIDRMYLNVYVAKLQRELGVVGFFRGHRGQTFASSALMDPMTREFVGAIEKFAKVHKIDVVPFAKGQRKDDVMQERLKTFTAEEGVVFIGKAQEKATVLRTEKRHHKDGSPYPWLVRGTAMVNQFYFYCVDRDFGPFFLKFCSYFPYNAKLCINGHEYLKRQLALRGVAFEALDNGLLSCADIALAQTISDELGPDQIDALLRKWLAILPHPFTPADRAAGYRYAISILQAEFSLTQVLDRPVAGRILFEELIRENLDIGRPDQIGLIFERRVNRRTPGKFRTRVITEGVTPSLHVDYKHCRVKQYHKEGRALRTETTINDSRDFAIGKALKNLPALRKIGFPANRRLLDVERISHDCALGETLFNQLQCPRTDPDAGRVAPLRFGDLRVQTLLASIVGFRHLPRGFANRDLRGPLAALRGLDPHELTQGKMTYELRRLRQHGLIESIPRSHRYRVTDFGLRVAVFYSRVHARLIRPGLADLVPRANPPPSAVRTALERVERVIDDWCAKEGLCPRT